MDHREIGGQDQSAVGATSAAILPYGIAIGWLARPWGIIQQRVTGELGSSCHGFLLVTRRGS